MNAYFKSTLALEFIQTGDLDFNLDVQVLKQCITMFGSEDATVTCELELSENGLCIKMEEKDVETECQLSLFDSSPLYDLQEVFFDHSTIVKLIVPSELIKIAFQEIDETCEAIRFRVSQESPHLEISGVGLAGESKIHFSNHSGVMDSFYCDVDCSFEYPLKMVQSSFKALALSQKVSLRINHMGLLCLQVFCFDVVFIAFDGARSFLCRCVLGATYFRLINRT
jgi:cell cycle checkpoint protein